MSTQDLLAFLLSPSWAWFLERIGLGTLPDFLGCCNGIGCIWWYVSVSSFGRERFPWNKCLGGKEWHTWIGADIRQRCWETPSFGEGLSERASLTPKPLKGKVIIGPFHPYRTSSPFLVLTGGRTLVPQFAGVLGLWFRRNSEPGGNSWP